MNFLIGFLAGLFGGLVGLGGGVVMIPLMIGIKKLSQQHAHGTSLVVLVFTGIMGAATYAYQGFIDVVAAILLAAAAIFTARSGAHIAHRLPEREPICGRMGEVYLVRDALFVKWWQARFFGARLVK